MNWLLHGCGYVNSSGTWKMVAKDHDCITLTNKCFWKNASDVATSINTTSMRKNEVSLKTINDYFKGKEKDNNII